MQELTKKIIEKLPTNWEKITLRDFIKLSSIEVSNSEDGEELFNSIATDIEVISLLTETPIGRIEELPMQDINLLREKIQFIAIEPKVNKKASSIFKTLEEITYNDFVTTNEILYKEPFKYMDKIIQCFSKKKMTNDEVLNMTMPEVMNGFFLQRQGLKKSFQGMIQSLRKQIINLLKKEKQIT